MPSPFECATAVQHAVAFDRLEWRRVPVVRVRRDDIDMVQQDDAGLIAAFEPCPDVTAPRSRLGELILDAFFVEDPRDELSAHRFIAGRVGRVDLDVGFEAFEGNGLGIEAGTESKQQDAKAQRGTKNHLDAPGYEGAMLTVSPPARNRPGHAGALAENQGCLPHWSRGTGSPFVTYHS